MKTFVETISKLVVGFDSLPTGIKVIFFSGLATTITYLTTQAPETGVIAIILGMVANVVAYYAQQYSTVKAENNLS